MPHWRADLLSRPACGRYCLGFGSGLSPGCEFPVSSLLVPRFSGIISGDEIACSCAVALLLFERTFEQWQALLPSIRNSQPDAEFLHPNRARRPGLTAAWPRYWFTPPTFSMKKAMRPPPVRNLPRASGVSLSGLYYYFESKEELLYLIQKDTFTTIVWRLREQLQDLTTRQSGLAVSFTIIWSTFLPTRRP